MKFYQLLFISFLCIMAGCDVSKTSNTQSDPLPSWNDVNTKKDIINFIQTVTDPNHQDFINIEDRIATFDNDGTLWTEKPIVQIQFAFDRIKELSKANPEWKNDPVFNAVLKDDLQELLKFGKKGLAKIMLTSHSGMTTDEFDTLVNNWITTANHPIKNRHYNELIYQPMLEVIEYLKANDFKVFIVSGGGMDFMRPWAEKTYGIPKNQIIGSSLKVVFELDENQTVLKRIPELNFFDDKEAKPVAIHQHIGRKPIMAFGNSDGDLQMLQWCASNSLKNLPVYIYHTDETREFKYGREDKIAKLDKGLDEAIAKNWTVVDMKNDWRFIYPFELKINN